MDWGYVVSGLLSGGIVLALIEWRRYRSKDKADAKNIDAEAESKITDNAMRFADRMEERLTKVEEDQVLMREQVNIYQRAINCAYRCGNVENPEQECPVLCHLYDEKTKEE